MIEPSEHRRRSAPPRRAATGFTLVELLVVLAVIVVLMGLVSGGANAALAASRQTKCANNLQSIATAALAYADDNRGELPWAYRTVPGYASWAWDFVVPKGGVPEPGVIWGHGGGMKAVLQCPAFVGAKANWKDDPYTGYNYNVSYVGKVEGDPGTRKAPARLSQLVDPARTAFFGDGQYSGGANKFMRAPTVDRANDATGTSVRSAGTQGFRHRGRTNMAFCDGHVEALTKPYQTNGKPGFVSPRCGFVSSGNRLYSLAK